MYIHKQWQTWSLSHAMWEYKYMTCQYYQPNLSHFYDNACAQVQFCAYN
jgi:hypothetical protein